MLLLPVISSTQKLLRRNQLSVTNLAFSKFWQVLAFIQWSPNFSLGGQTKVETPKIEV